MEGGDEADDDDDDDEDEDVDDVDVADVDDGVVFDVLSPCDAPLASPVGTAGSDPTTAPSDGDLVGVQSVEAAEESQVFSLLGLGSKPLVVSCA